MMAFINKLNDTQTNSTTYSFYTSSLIDGNAVDENSSIPAAASASYGLTVSSDNSIQIFSKCEAS